MATTTHSASGLTTTLAHSDTTPLAGSFITGLIASLCCGGSLIFASMGLGAIYSALGMWRFIPQALAAGAITIVAINYLYYRRAAKPASVGAHALRAKMFISTAIGLVMMAGTFIFLEWLNHAVINADRFLARPEFSQALIKGVPNVELVYVGATFFALVLLWALPFPRASAAAHDDDWMKRAARVAVFGATTLLVIGVVVDGSSKFGAPTAGHEARAGSHGAPSSGGQHGKAH